MPDRSSRTDAPLADLGRDVAGSLPDDLLTAWERSPRTPELAARLLAPLAREGVVVCSDTSGLSKMTSRLPVPVVLKRIGEPKCAIHALGTGLGGRAIGTWVADNTEMLYAAEVDLDALVTGLVRLHDNAPVGFGFCVHRGTFYEVGGGLYGPDADLVEELAEHHSSGGDTLLTRATWAELDPGRFESQLRQVPGLGEVVAVRTDRAGPPITGRPTYPLPYDPQMHALLEALDSPDDTAQLAQIDLLYRHDSTVLLALHRRAEPDSDPLVATVEGLVGDRRFQEVAQRALARSTPWWNVGGPLALAAFDTPEEGLAAARALRGDCRRAGLPVSLGLAGGVAYRFPMPGGRTELAGDPVNRASKLAEDLGAPDLLLVETSVHLPVPDQARRHRFQISGIALEAWEG